MSASQIDSTTTIMTNEASPIVDEDENTSDDQDIMLQLREEYLQDSNIELTDFQKV